MAYKPEKIDNGPICAKSRRRLARDAKKAVNRLRRRAERRDPENAPTRRELRGWIS
jgi:hypothetical protein